MNFKKYKNNFLDYVLNQRYGILTELYSEIYYLTYKWMKKNNIKCVNLPITTQSVSSPMGLGSDSLPYKVISKKNKYEFYLADSMQFYLELLLRVRNVESVGYISSSFRGEEVDKRHLHQFNHFEVEFKYDLKKTKKLIIKYLKYVVKNLLKTHKKELEFFDKDNSWRLNKWLTNKVINLSFNDGIKILDRECKHGISQQNNFISINSIGEKYLIEKFKEKIIWLNNFPEILVPFYQQSINGYAINSDLLIGIGETIGAGQRSFDYNETINSIKKHKNNPEEYEWYLKMKSEKPLLTSGFGMGIERFMLFLIGEDDIREVQLIPRETDLEVLP